MFQQCCFCSQETYKLPHRLIEKKRRDRINECIAQLKDLLPEHLKLTVSSPSGETMGWTAIGCMRRPVAAGVLHHRAGCVSSL